MPAVFSRIEGGCTGIQMEMRGFVLAHYRVRAYNRGIDNAIVFREYDDWVLHSRTARAIPLAARTAGRRRAIT